MYENDSTTTEPTRDELSLQINTLQRENERLARNEETYRHMAASLRINIDNAAGVIRDFYSENGELTDELREIAEHLKVKLTKTISGTVTVEFTFSAEVPIEFDPDDLEFTPDLSCDNYDLEDVDIDVSDITVDVVDE